jgi:hypothetical protein
VASGGGGIYVLENPSAPRAEWKIRPLIDPTTPGTPGGGVYSHPELSRDATKLLFCFKGEPNGSTSIYEIGIDGKGLRRLTDPRPSCGCYKGTFGGGVHDVAPAYMPDGRIVLLSTRPSGLVPCMNSGVAILHVMNADGRILFGRWEYVDKNALTIQSLWTVNPDGTQETALFANNRVFPEAVLDARTVPGSAGSSTPWCSPRARAAANRPAVSAQRGRGLRRRFQAIRFAAGAARWAQRASNSANCSSIRRLNCRRDAQGTRTGTSAR